MTNFEKKSNRCQLMKWLGVVCCFLIVHTERHPMLVA